MKSRSASSPFAVWMVLFTVVPLAVVVWFAFTDDNGAFTFANIAAIGEYWDTFWDSIWQGALSTLICLLLAYPLAFSISRATERVQQTMVMIVMLPMWMNFLLRTYAWMSILEDKGFINQFLGLFGWQLHMINTDGAVILGMVYNFLPFMVLPLYSMASAMEENQSPSRSFARSSGGKSINGTWVYRQMVFRSFKNTRSIPSSATR